MLLLCRNHFQYYAPQEKELHYADAARTTPQ
jgi:hypothetical protein